MSSRSGPLRLPSRYPLSDATACPDLSHDRTTTRPRDTSRRDRAKHDPVVSPWVCENRPKKTPIPIFGQGRLKHWRQCSDPSPHTSCASGSGINRGMLTCAPGPPSSDRRSVRTTVWRYSRSSAVWGGFPEAATSQSGLMVGHSHLEWPAQSSRQCRCVIEAPIVVLRGSGERSCRQACRTVYPIFLALTFSVLGCFPAPPHAEASVHARGFG